MVAGAYLVPAILNASILLMVQHPITQTRDVLLHVQQQERITDQVAHAAAMAPETAIKCLVLCQDIQAARKGLLANIIVRELQLLVEILEKEVAEHVAVHGRRARVKQ